MYEHIYSLLLNKEVIRGADRPLNSVTFDFPKT